MSSVSRLLETALYVDDLERSARFYQQVLGLGAVEGTASERENWNPVLRPLHLPGGQVLLLFRKGSTPTMTVLPGGTIPPHGGEGRLHLAFAIPTAELEQCKDRLRALEISIEGEMAWPRGGTSLYFRDPDGHLVELATPGLWSVY
jgi:catechol 2,3-dioxygenase-like lactoylglutathione lyase family enzyme